MATEQFGVHNRWTNKVQFTAPIECAPDDPISVKLGLAVRWGYKSGVKMSGADLRGADLSSGLSGGDLRGAYLSGADMSGARLRGADMSDCPVKILNIHQAVYEAASKPGALNMSYWHCATSHCRAGWVVTLAGEGGKALEYAFGTALAATMIYLASDPSLEKVPDFNGTNADALADMKRLAEQVSA